MIWIASCVAASAVQAIERPEEPQPVTPVEPEKKECLGPWSLALAVIFGALL